MANINPPTLDPHEPRSHTHHGPPVTHKKPVIELPKKGKGRKASAKAPLEASTVKRKKPVIENAS